MTTATTVVGALIVLISTGSFMASQDLLTLMPTSLGLLLVVLGWLGRLPSRQALAGHIAVGATFIGMVLSAPATGVLFATISGASVQRPAATLAVGLTGVLCLIHVTLSIRWFLARKRSASA